MSREKPKNHNLKAVPTPGETAAAARAIEQTDECPKCFGTGMEVVKDKGARICDCRKRRSSVGKFDRMSLPRRYENCHFNSYKPENESQRIALRLSQQFTNEFPAVDRGLLLMGSVGVGKTHLAVSILKGLTERGFRCLFKDFAALLKEIQDSYDSRTFASELSVLSPVLRADALVLDELGASKPTDWVRDTMADIINTRYNDKKLTVFTTNYLDERASEGKEILEDRIGMRLRSRLFEMSRTVILDGKDFRRTFDR